MGRVKWLTHPGSRVAHALREKPVKVRQPSTRLSWCGRVAWTAEGSEAPLTMLQCQSCDKALRLVA